MCFPSVLISISHISCSSAARQNPPDLPGTGKAKKRDREAAAEERCAKPWPQKALRLTCVAVISALAAVQPWVTPLGTCSLSWDLLSLLGILPFNLLPLITDLLSRAWLLTAKAVLAPRSCWVRRQSPLLLLDPSGYWLTWHCHTATASVLPLLSRVGLVPAWLQGSLAQWPKTARN